MDGCVAVHIEGRDERAECDVLLAGPDLASGVRTAFVGAGRTLEATGYADACLIETLALEVASTNEPLRLATAELFDSWLDSLTLLLVLRAWARRRRAPSRR